MRKSLMFSLFVSLLLGLSSLSFGAARLLSDTLYIGDNISSYTLYTYNAGGFKISDSTFDVNGKLSQWIAYTVDANGNITQREVRSPAATGTAGIPKALNVYIIQNNLMVIDSFWYNGSYASPTARSSKLTSVNNRSYADGKPSIDSVSNKGDTLLYTNVYKYHTDKDSLIQYDPLNAKLSMVVSTKDAKGNVTSKVNYKTSSAKTDSVVDNTVYEYDATSGLLVSAKYYLGTSSTLQNVVFSNWSTAIFNQYFRNGSSNTSFPFTSLSLASVNNAVNLSFNLSKASPVAIRLFNASGAQIASLSNTWFAPGTHSVALTNNNPLPSGCYVIDIANGKQALAKSIYLVR